MEAVVEELGKYTDEKIGWILCTLIYISMLLDTGGALTRTTYFLLVIFVVLIYLQLKYKGYLVVERKEIQFWKAIILLGGLISTVCGIDRGESIYGMVRLLVIFFASLALQQIDDNHKSQFMKVIPFLGILELMFSCLSYVPIFSSWISTTNRIAGSFEYPNTMALFLIIGIIISEDFESKWKRIIQLVLGVGVLATGSRTAFILLCVYIFCCFIKYRSVHIGYLIMTLLIIIGVITLSLNGLNLFGSNRFTTISVNSSTFQGRLLYWEDAIRMLLKYPMGLGYMGYFYIQQVMQTGVYSVRFVHNEWLQLMLDYGILAGIGTVGYIVSQFRINKISRTKMELFILIAVYSFFDFHLQYWSIILILLLMEPQGNVSLECSWSKIKYGCGLLLLMSMLAVVKYGIAGIYAQCGNYEKAVKWDGMSTDYKLKLLLEASNLENAEYYADQVLKGNRYVYAAYLIKSNAAAENGLIDDFIENRRKVLELKKYDIDEYEDYFKILLMWYIQAKNINDNAILEKCTNEMIEIPIMINEVKLNTNLRAFRIYQKPELQFNKEYEAFINMLQGE
jgi:hypothetical protein